MKRPPEKPVPQPAPPAPRRLTPAVADAAAILELLRTAAPVPLSLSEIIRHLGLSKGGCHAILQTLVSFHLVIQHPLEKTYGLGPALIGLGLAAVGDAQLLEAIRLPLAGLARTTGFGAAATKLLPNAHVTIIARAESLRPMQIAPVIGSIFPLTPPFGAVFMAWTPEHELERWFATASASGFGPVSEAERTAYLADIRRVRERGFAYGVRVSPESESGLSELRSWLDQSAAIGLDERSEADRVVYIEDMQRLAQLPPEHRPMAGMVLPIPLVNLSAPVFDFDGRVALAVSISGFTSEIPPERILALGSETRLAADTVTAAIGGRSPASRAEILATARR